MLVPYFSNCNHAQAHRIHSGHGLILDLDKIVVWSCFNGEHVVFFYNEIYFVLCNNDILFY